MEYTMEIKKEKVAGYDRQKEKEKKTYLVGKEKEKGS